MLGSLYPEGYQNPESSRCPGGSTDSSTPDSVLLVGTDTHTLPDETTGPADQVMNISICAAIRGYSNSNAENRDPQSEQECWQAGVTYR